MRARLTARFDILRLTTRGKARNRRVTSSRSGISATVSAAARARYSGGTSHPAAETTTVAILCYKSLLCERYDQLYPVSSRAKTVKHKLDARKG